MGTLGVDDLEDVRSCAMAMDEVNELVEAAHQCVYTFTTASGWPMGVVMSYLYADGAFWLTAVHQRNHVRAAERDSRVSIVIMNNGTDLDGRRMCTVKGNVTVYDDRETLDWFLPRFAARHQPATPEPFIRLLDSENRVVMKVEPVSVPVSHDSRKIAGNGRGN
jgi:general stress protein 26